MATPETNIEGDFRERAKKVFPQFRDPYEKATQDARMMWLAWRGEGRFVQVHLSDEAGVESSWQFCDYAEIPRLIGHYKHVEVRPMSIPFADHIAAFLVVVMQKQVGEGAGVRVYSRSGDTTTLQFVETEITMAEAYDRVKSGSEVIADWVKNPGDVLKTRSISISPNQFSYLDYVRVGDKTPLNARGFIYLFKKQDRAARRRRRQSAVRWVMSG